MKKNNSFKLTFYFGFCIMLLIVSILTLIIVNVWRALEPNIKNKKVEVVASEYLQLESEKIHDTVYIEKIPTKTTDSPKIIVQPKINKKQVSLSETKDTSSIFDTVR